MNSPKFSKLTGKYFVCLLHIQYLIVCYEIILIKLKKKNN